MNIEHQWHEKFLFAITNMEKLYIHIAVKVFYFLQTTSCITGATKHLAKLLTDRRMNLKFWTAVCF